MNFPFWMFCFKGWRPLLAHESSLFRSRYYFYQMNRDFFHRKFAQCSTLKNLVLDPDLDLANPESEPWFLYEEIFVTVRSIFSFKFFSSIVKQVSGLVQSELADLHPSQILHVGDDMDKALSYVVFFQS
jgi:hypothetical protein